MRELEVGYTVIDALHYHRARLNFLVWWNGLPEDHPRKWSPSDRPDVREQARKYAREEMDQLLNMLAGDRPNA